MQYQPYDEAEAFDPIKRIDYIPTLDRNIQRMNAADEQAFQQLQRNNQTRIKNAERVGEDLIALSGFSKKLTNTVIEAYKEEQKKQQLEQEQQGMERFMRGELDMSDQNQLMSQVKDQSRVISNVEADVLGDNSENYEASAAISKNSASRTISEKRGFAKAAMITFPSFMESNVNITDYSDRASYLAAWNRARQTFMDQNGILNLKPEFLATTVYPQMLEERGRALSKWSKWHAQEDSEKRRDDAYFDFASTLDIATVLDATRNTVDANGNPLGFRGAWDLWTKRVAEMRKAGMLSATDVENMKNQPIPGDPKGRTYGELYEARFANMERQVNAQARQDWQNEQADRQMAFQQEEQQIVDAFLDSVGDPDGFTEDQLNEAIDALRDRHGFVSTKLGNLQASTVDAKDREKQEGQIEDLIQLNLLTPERLQKFDPTLQRKYMAQAQAIAKTRKENGDFKTQEQAIKDLVEQTAGVTRDTVSHYSVGLKTAQQQQRFHQLVQQYAASGQETDPAGKALAQVITEFKSNYPDSTYVDPKNGYTDMIPDAKQSNDAEARMKFTLDVLDSKLKQFGQDVLDRPDSLFTTTQLEQFVKGYGLPGWKTSPQIDHIANILNVDPLTALNRQLKANGMTELPPSPAMEIIQNELSPAQHRLLRQFKTPYRSARAFTSIAQYKPELVPKGYGSMIEEAAKKHGLEPSIVAGLIETESAWNPNAVSGAGAQGLAQFMPATAQEFGVIPFNPESAINGAAQYLKYLVDYFNGDLRLAIYAYNGGMGNIQKYGGPIPGSTENQEYYGKVIKAAGKYGYGKQALADPGTMRSSIAQQL